MTKNKFVKPPYLPDFDEDWINALIEILEKIDGAAESPKRIMHLLHDLKRPSKVRKCDLFALKPVVDLINWLDYTYAYFPISPHEEMKENALQS